MKRICALMMKDLRLVMKNLFFRVMLGMLAAIVFVINFLLPQRMETASFQIVTCGFEAEGYPHADHMEHLRKLVKQDKNVIGVLWDEENYTIMADNLSGKQAAAVILPFADQKAEAAKIRVLRISDKAAPQPFHKRCLPVFLCFEAIIQGFLLAGLLMLNEKSEKTAYALQVSPVNAFHYWAAKILLFSVMGSVYAFFMALLTVGFHFPVMPYLLVSFTASALFTMPGMITAACSRSVNNWFMMASLILGINMLTLFAYIVPSLSIPFMRLIPSYPLLFIYEQILFGTPALTFDATVLIVWSIVLAAASIVCIKYRFLRPQKGEKK